MFCCLCCKDSLMSLPRMIRVAVVAEAEVASKLAPSLILEWDLQGATWLMDRCIQSIYTMWRHFWDSVVEVLGVARIDTGAVIISSLLSTCLSVRLIWSGLGKN
ncbi:hypothetical protein H5410_032403 [Solanum commersonii]|uniref:Uncharacterized protein n=1 Tax=Solanum commersonii TaxID=4109 RepID=A0A9J5YKZ1_SOLCO|nr:hypothetical protein H5410_032403 [Solanum commersonii]